MNATPTECDADAQPPENTLFCRTCLTPTAELRSIYKAGMICGQVTKLADMLANCTNLEVSGCIARAN